MCSCCGAKIGSQIRSGCVQCEVCGAPFEVACGERSREGFHRDARQPSASERLEDFAEVYGYSARRFRDQVGSGRVLNVGLENGGLAFRGALNDLVGPVADKPQEVLLPTGTKGLSVDVCPGSVISGRPWVERVDLDRLHPRATLRCPPGCSGTIVRVFCEA